MHLIQFSIYYKTIVFLSFLLFLISFLFQNLIPALSALAILVFLIYTKFSFIKKVGKITASRKLFEKQIFVNHPINIKTKVKNGGKQINLKIIDNPPENSTITKGKNQIEKLLNQNEEITIDYQIKFNSRGKKDFKNIDLEITDLSNLYKINIQKTLTETIWVHSDPEEIKKAKRVSQREHIEIDTPSLMGLETLDEMQGTREFQPGDKLKDIDWKATSRFQKIMTKLFEKKELLDTIVLLDCSHSMRRTSGNISKINHATNLAVSLTKILQSIRHPIGLVAFDEYKIIKSVNPTNNYSNIFESLTDLPSQIKTKDYKSNESLELNQIEKETSVEQKNFISTVFPFLAKGRRKIKSPTQATGVYEAIRVLMMDNKTKHIIFLTDLETNIQSIYRAITLAHSKKYNVWLLAPFSPFYNIDKEKIDTGNLEELYKLKQTRDSFIQKIRKLNIEIVELTPLMEGVKVIEQVRGKKK